MKTQKTAFRTVSLVIGGASLSMILSLGLAACQSTPGPSHDDDDDAGGGFTIGAPPTSGSTPEQVCRRMLDCLSVIDPQQASIDIAIFGDSGTCWVSDQDRATCGTVCAQRLEDLHEVHWNEPACAECLDDVDCGDDRVCAHGACIERCEVSITGCCDALCAESRARGCESSSACSGFCYELAEAPPDCLEALTALYRCQATGLPETMVCSQWTDPSYFMASCGHCDAERLAVPVVCGELLTMPCE